MTEPVRLAIHGASGRMGVEVLRAARNRKDCRIAAALVRAASTWVDEPLSRVLGDGSPDFDFIAHLDPEIEVDVIVDFSTPDALETALAIAQTRQVAFLCGTTGLNEHQFARLRLASERIPVLWSSNFSLGVALLKRMAALAAAQLGPEFEAEILEIHHRGKRDAPSGTALALGRAIAEARQHPFEDVVRYARHGTTMETRTPDEIGFAVLRAADVVGEHTVMFASEGERIEITHRANSRGIFATGAVRSAIWLARQPPGWYDVSDVLA
jgi:4-hydroxy-tetrahydrodipicolinate reductase